MEKEFHMPRVGIGGKVRSSWSKMRKDRRERIRKWSKKEKDANKQRRLLIVLGFVQEKSAAEIAAGLHCSAALVYKVAQTFLRAEDKLQAFDDRRTSNGSRVLTRQVELVLKVLVAESPREFQERRTTWNLTLLARVLERRTAVRLSASSVSRCLRRLGIRLKMARPFVACPWPKTQRDLRLARLRRLLLAARPGDVWLFVDEVDIHLNPKIGRDYMLPGVQKRIRTPGVNQKRYLAGALNAFTGRLTYVEGAAKNSQLFVDLILRLGREYPGKRLHLILDNYCIHKSHFTKHVRAQCAGLVRFHFLPAYSPDENRIERVWENLHANVTRNHPHATMEELMSEVRHWLRGESRRLKQEYAKTDANTRYADYGHLAL
jgi:transposase